MTDVIETTIHDLRDLCGPPDADAVVVIDVLRAFSTAAVALDRGAVEIYPVLDVADAFDRRAREPDLVLMGETDCRPVPGFDMGNSPVAAAAFPFAGRRAVQRTTAGTRESRANSASRSASRCRIRGCMMRFKAAN